MDFIWRKATGRFTIHHVHSFVSKKYCWFVSWLDRIRNQHWVSVEMIMYVGLVVRFALEKQFQ